MFKKLENKIKELALKIHDSKSNDLKSIYEDSKKLYELTVIHKYLTNHEKGDDWILHEEKLKETLKSLNLETNVNKFSSFIELPSLSIATLVVMCAF